MAQEQIEIAVTTPNTARQPKYAAITPETVAPNIWPKIDATRNRLAATWRSESAVRSPMRARPTGKIPPATMPAIARDTISVM